MSDAQLEPDDAFVPLQAETMMGDLRDFILDRLKHDHSPLPWNMRPEQEQRALIDATEIAVRRWVHRACGIIAAGGQKAARGSMVRLLAKDGIQMQINVAASEPLRHELMDHVGNSVLVIIADDVASFSGERAPVKVTPDQRDILDEDGGAEAQAA